MVSIQPVGWFLFLAYGTCELISFKHFQTQCSPLIACKVLGIDGVGVLQAAGPGWFLLLGSMLLCPTLRLDFACSQNPSSPCPEFSDAVSLCFCPSNPLYSFLPPAQCLALQKQKPPVHLRVCQQRG